VWTNAAIVDMGVKVLSLRAKRQAAAGVARTGGQSPAVIEGGVTKTP